MFQPWKFLVYIAADNHLYSPSQVSLREITDASLFSDVEIMVQLDGPSGEMSSRYRCARGSKKLLWEAPEGYTTNRKTRLIDFLDAAAANANPNQRVLLVLWGEGAGLDHVYLYSDPSATANTTPLNMADEPILPSTTPSDLAQLSLANQALAGLTADVLNGPNANRYVKDIELGSIFLNFSRKIGRPIDILGFDACLMALAEICYEVRDSVSLIVGSDEEVPKQSWPYAQLLRDLARFPGMDADVLATLIISRFIEKYTKDNQQTTVSLTAIKLSAGDELVAAMKQLVDAFHAGVSDVAFKRRIFRARDASRTADETSYIDFGAFCSELLDSFDENTQVHAGARRILFALKNLSFILYHRDAAEDKPFAPYGLALYFPLALPPDADGLAAVQATNTLQTYFALDAEKDPPHGPKFPPGSADSPTQITSYQIIWSSYVELDFNAKTGWSTLLARLLEGEIDQSAINA